jgi:hypothetical protein
MLREREREWWFVYDIRTGASYTSLETAFFISSLNVKQRINGLVIKLMLNNSIL